ncbi:MAG: c-type cytochrome, partial [Bacteroidales bacterium]
MSKVSGMTSFLFVAAMFVSMTLTAQEPAEPWEVSAKYKNMENPESADAASVKVGRMLYNKNCASCHGKTGLGDGSKARGLDTNPGDMSASAYQSQTDGEQFYKSKFGRNEMPK